MEKLIERFRNGQCGVHGCGSNCKHEYKYCANSAENCPTFDEIYEKLAQYEDTELTPGQIKEMKQELAYMRIAQASFKSEVNGYKNAEEQGLLLRLPVAISSDVYFIPSKVNYDLNVLSKHEENNRVYHQKVSRIVFTERGWYIECNLDLEYGTDRILVDKLYQETWFTTKEEAEQALKQMGE